ncbi:unnamed protein product [Clonostachys rhizophaga]|uniref:Uncharacterized protein n=1 Tax=Clonostachys rhizophaga TaxID=160324 RepID=A0A9N9W4D2_9HYPO|nr:unnamed protein product [Clonostachys rhizophaga]
MAVVTEVTEQLVSGKGMPELLQRRNDKKEIFKLLLDKRVYEALEFVEVLPNRWKEILELLLEKCGDQIQIGPDVIIETSAAQDRGSALEMFLGERGSEIQLTRAAADTVLSMEAARRGKSDQRCS